MNAHPQNFPSTVGTAQQGRLTQKWQSPPAESLGFVPDTGIRMGSLDPFISQWEPKASLQPAQRRPISCIPSDSGYQGSLKHELPLTQHVTDHPLVSLAHNSWKS